MNSPARIYAKAAVLVLTAFTFVSNQAMACGVCMGSSDAKVGDAVNGAIFLMLAFIGTMLAALAGFGFYLMKRANAPLSPHLGVAHIANDLEEQS